MTTTLITLDHDKAEAALSVLMKDAQAVVEAVTIDDSGQMIGQIWQGGNGGLLSHTTIRAVDKLRSTLAAIKTAKTTVGSKD